MASPKMMTQKLHGVTSRTPFRTFNIPCSLIFKSHTTLNLTSSDTVHIYSSHSNPYIFLIKPTRRTNFPNFIF